MIRNFRASGSAFLTVGLSRFFSRWRGADSGRGSLKILLKLSLPIRSKIMFGFVQDSRLRVLLVSGLLAVSFFAASLVATAQTTAPNEWTWMGGSKTDSASGVDQSGIYGTLGTPAAANVPGSR